MRPPRRLMHDLTRSFSSDTTCTGAQTRPGMLQAPPLHHQPQGAPAYGCFPSCDGLLGFDSSRWSQLAIPAERC